MFAYHIIKVMEVLYRENNHHANIQSEKPTKNMSPTILLPRGLLVNLPPPFHTVLCAHVLGILHMDTESLATLCGHLQCLLSLGWEVYHHRVCRIASHVPGSCLQIYSFTLNSCNQRLFWLWHLVMILRRYFFSGYCMDMHFMWCNQCRGKNFKLLTKLIHLHFKTLNIS